MKEELNPLEANPDNIWFYAQNKPSLIAKDLEKYGVPNYITYSILIARGVFKWLGVRRLLIKLKHTWKDELVELHKELVTLRAVSNPPHHVQQRIAEIRGEIKTYERCRKEVRALCHSERWTCPDFDAEARNYLLYRTHLHKATMKNLKKALEE